LCITAKIGHPCLKWVRFGKAQNEHNRSGVHSKADSRLRRATVPTGRHLDVAPAFERREQHEQIGGSVALVLDSSRLPRFHRDRDARLGNELF
jgi:hypothetical protein